jgi:hypothetical protein
MISRGGLNSMASVFCFSKSALVKSAGKDNADGAK